MTDHGLDMSVIEPYLQAHPYPRIFLTVSGAHLYGFASPDSDYDLRGCHLIPARDMLRISTPRETYEVLDRDAPIEMDIVTHDARKYFDMLVGKNGYVLEQIFSPLVIEASADLEELKDIARSCITRHHRHHFRSFASKQWDNVANAANRTVKGLLYTYRPLMAGIHLMRTGEIESNLRTLNTSFAFPFIECENEVEVFSNFLNLHSFGKGRVAVHHQLALAFDGKGVGLSPLFHRFPIRINFFGPLSNQPAKLNAVVALAYVEEDIGGNVQLGNVRVDGDFVGIDF